MDIGKLNYYRKINNIMDGRNCREALIDEMVNDFNNAHNKKISRFDVMIKSNKAIDTYINFSEEPIKAIIDLKKKYTASSEMEESIQTYPSLIKRGDYIRFKRRKKAEYYDYIITSEIKELDNYNEGVFVKCNQTLKFIIKGVAYEYPCIIDNESYGVKIVTTEDDGKSNSVKIKITVQENEITRQIIPDTRFIFNHSKYDIYKIGKIDTASKENIIIFTAEISNYMQEDDIDNNIAYQPIAKSEKDVSNNNEKIKTSYSIIGKYEVVHKNSYKYYLEPNNIKVLWTLDDIDNELDMGKISFDQKDNSCNLYINEITSYSDNLTLIAKDENNNILAEKKIIINKK